MYNKWLLRKKKRLEFKWIFGYDLQEMCRRALKQWHARNRHSRVETLPGAQGEIDDKHI